MPRASTILPEHPQIHPIRKSHIARVLDPTHSEETPLTQRCNPNDFRPINARFKSIDVEKELERIRNTEKRSCAITPNQFNEQMEHTSSSLADDLKPILSHEHSMPVTKDSSIVKVVEFLDVPQKV